MSISFTMVLSMDMPTTTSNAITHDRLLYRVKEAAWKLDVSTSQAYNLINRGELEAVRVGRSVRVPARALEKIARSGTAV
jgi:excisionase family DNA binding protein